MMAGITDTTTPDRRSSRVPTWVDDFIGRRIQQRRVVIGVSQFHLAAKVGLTFQQIQKFEAGINRVPASRLFDIAAVLKAAPGDFFPESDEQAPQLPQGDIISAQASIAEMITPKSPCPTINRCPPAPIPRDLLSRWITALYGLLCGSDDRFRQQTRLD